MFIDQIMFFFSLLYVLNSVEIVLLFVYELTNVNLTNKCIKQNEIAEKLLAIIFTVI